MKRLFSIGIIILSACNKKTTNIPVSSTWNKITIVDNGITYTDSQLVNSNPKSMRCSFQEQGNKYNIGLTTEPQKGAISGIPIAMSIGNAVRAGGILGIYKEVPKDSIANDCIFVEIFNVDMSYSFDSVIVNIATFSVDTIIGSYQIWLDSMNGTGNKIIRGTFNFYDAEVY